jgi:hypothetical protein
MNKLAKDMSKVYRNTTTADLIRNRNRKTVELFRVSKMSGYWAKKESARLAHMILQIEVELAARALQQPLF